MGWLTPRPRYSAVAAKIGEIEREMKRIGMWQQQPLAPEQRHVTTAFGQGVMSFEQWLQFIFIPNVRTIIQERGKFPSSSSVAAQAIREWGSGNDTDHLFHLLAEFDDLFGWSFWGLFRKLDELVDSARKRFL